MADWQSQSSILNIDEVALFDTALSANDVENLYNGAVNALSPGVSIKEFYTTGNPSLTDNNRISTHTTVGWDNNRSYINCPIKTSHKAYIEYVVTGVNSSSPFRFGFGTDREFQGNSQLGDVYVEFDGTTDLMRLWSQGPSNSGLSSYTAGPLVVNDVVAIALDFDAMTIDVKLNNTALITGKSLTGGTGTWGHDMDDYSGSVWTFMQSLAPVSGGTYTKAFLRSAEADLTGTKPAGGYLALEDLPQDASIAAMPSFTAVSFATNVRPDDYARSVMPSFSASTSADAGLTTSAIDYFATKGFTTSTTSTPAGEEIPPTLENPGNFKREINIDDFGITRPSFGEIVISNIDGIHDTFLTKNVDGQRAVLYYNPTEDVFVLSIENAQ